MRYKEIVRLCQVTKFVSKLTKIVMLLLSWNHLR